MAEVKTEVTDPEEEDDEEAMLARAIEESKKLQI
jgi:hypothetical protein